MLPMKISKPTTFVVNEISKVNFSGNIVPNSWWKHLKNSSGKPYDKAIAILSEIIYWYRKTEIRDEITGHTIGYERKFCGDKLQHSYTAFAEKFGYTKREVKAAVDYLVSIGLVVTELRKVKVQGVVQNNVMYIEPIPEKIIEISTPPTMKRRRLFQGNVGGSHRESHHPHTLKRKTNTKNTTKINQDTTATNAAVDHHLEKLHQELQLDDEVKSWITEKLATKGEEYVNSNIEATIANANKNPRAYLWKALRDDYGKPYRIKRQLAGEKTQQAVQKRAREKEIEEAEAMKIQQARNLYNSLPEPEKKKIYAEAEKVSGVKTPHMIEATVLKLISTNCLPPERSI